MPLPPARRQFLKGVAAVTTASAIPWFPSQAESNSPFRVAVINDEISQDFGHACEIASREFGMSWIELRSMWEKNIVSLDEKEVAEARSILEKYQMKVTDIASPLFKVDWPGAPKSKYSEAKSFGANFSLAQQDEVLDRAIAMAKAFAADRVRCFDFWRLDDQAPYRAAMDDKLRETAETAAKQGVLLVLENEFECNTATGREAARTLNAVKSPNLALNWDPANAVMRGELDAFPTAWDLLPKDRIHHCHCKNAVKDAAGKIEWSPVDKGFIDWAAQFRALQKAGFRDAVSLETHWRGAVTAEESTRISWAGMRQALKDSGTL